MIKKIFLMCVSFFLITFILSAETEGERLFRENQSEAAIITLENEIKKGNITANTYNFLGLCYFQLGNYEKSIEVFQKGLEMDGVNKVVIYFNLGNSFFMSEKLKEAIECYKNVSLIEKNYSSSYLNKANCEVSVGYYEDAISDYEEFLRQQPEDIQRPQIEELLKLLREEVRIQKENERLAEMQRKAEEEAAMAAMVQMISDEIENDLQELAQRDAEEKLRKEAELKALEQSQEIIESDENILQAVEEDSMLQQAIEIENERILKEKEEEIKRKQQEEELKKQKQMEEELQRQRIEDEKNAADTNKKNESERRRKLLEDIANSLQGTDDQNINSGSSDIIEYEYESELD